jgi:3'(2'), 5'-bisphosphate nucleotidase
MSYQREQETAIDAVRAASQLCQAVQHELTGGVLEKEDRTPVTVADFGSQALVCRTLRDAFPGDPILAEEDAGALRHNEDVLRRVVSRVQAVRPEAGAEATCAWIDAGSAETPSEDRCWVLDPIDGTKGFVRGDQYAIALALLEDGVPQVAALCCPNLPMELDDPGEEVPNGAGSIYTAVRGEGATWWPLAGGDAESAPATVSDTKQSGQARFCESYESSHSAHGAAAQAAERLNITAPPVRVDSQAKYAIVARGEADIYLRLPTRPGYVEKIWDHAAGMLVVSEAGGRVTDMHGKALDFRRGAQLSDNEGIVASNGALHDEVIDALGATETA